MDKFCGECGSKSVKNQKFCTNCGNKQSDNTELNNLNENIKALRRSKTEGLNFALEAHPSDWFYKRSHPMAVELIEIKESENIKPIFCKNCNESLLGLCTFISHGEQWLCSNCFSRIIENRSLWLVPITESEVLNNPDLLRGCAIHFKGGEFFILKRKSRYTGGRKKEFCYFGKYQSNHRDTPFEKNVDFFEISYTSNLGEFELKICIDCMNDRLKRNSILKRVNNLVQLESIIRNL